MNWKLFSPEIWKTGTLRKLIKRLYLTCFSIKYTKEELNHIKFIFEKHTHFPKCVILQLLNKAQMDSVNN